MGRPVRALDAKAIGQRIQDRIEILGYTQIDFAETIGVARLTVSKLLHGHNAPSLETLALVAAELDVSCDWLVFGLNQARPRTPRKIEISLSRCRDLLEWVDGEGVESEEPQKFAKVVDLLWNLRFNHPTPNLHEASGQPLSKRVGLSVPTTTQRGETDDDPLSTSSGLRGGRTPVRDPVCGERGIPTPHDDGSGRGDTR